MKRYALFVALALLVAIPLSAQGQRALAWPQTDHASEGVVRFEVKYDGGNYVNVGKNALPGVPNEFYSLLPASVQTGQHTAVVRACNATGCGADSAEVTIQAPVPAAPGTVRVIAAP